MDRKKKVLSYFGADYDNIRESAKDIEWTKLIDATDIDQAWGNFKRAIDQLKQSIYQSRRQYKASVNGALGKQQNVEEQKKRHGKSIEYLKMMNHTVSIGTS